MKEWLKNLLENIKHWADAQIEDTERAKRAGFAVGCWILILILIPAIFTGWLGIRLSFSMAIWAFVMMFSIRPFMVSVPEYAALVTINLLGHGIEALKEYKTGLWFRFPWEQAKIGNYINLRLLPLGQEEDYPAKDGPKMYTKWQAPYRVINAITYIGVGREALEGILVKAGSGVLSAYIAKHKAEVAKEDQEGAERALELKFANMQLKEKYGVEIPVVTLADLDYEDSVQAVRASQYVARKLKEMAHELQAEGIAKGKPMSDSDALTNAMIIHGKTTAHVNEVKGEGGNALAALLIAMAQCGGGDGKQKQEGGHKK